MEWLEMQCVKNHLNLMWNVVNVYGRYSLVIFFLIMVCIMLGAGDVNFSAGVCCAGDLSLLVAGRCLGDSFLWEVDVGATCTETGLGMCLTRECVSLVADTERCSVLWQLSFGCGCRSSASCGVCGEVGDVGRLVFGCGHVEMIWSALGLVLGFDVRWRRVVLGFCFERDEEVLFLSAVVSFVSFVTCRVFEYRVCCGSQGRTETCGALV